MVSRHKIGVIGSMKRTKPTQPRLDESLLAHVPPFSKLETRQIREILDQASSKRYDEGVAVFEEGDEAERFFMLLDGYIRVVRISPSGEQVIALHIPCGQLFGSCRFPTAEALPRPPDG